MMTKINKKVIGTGWERLAADFLIKNNYRIIESNFRCRSGEIDIVAENDGYLVFVEVKYRHSGCEAALEAVNIHKQRKIIGAAKFYLYSNGFTEDTPVRFDVIAMSNDEITLIKDAFQVGYR